MYTLNKRLGWRLACASMMALSVAMMPFGTAAADAGSAAIEGQVSVQAASGQAIYVTILNVDTGVVSSASVDGSGAYSLAGLPPGNYQVIAKSGGNESRSDVLSVRLGQVAVVDIDSAGAGAIDEIVVTATQVRQSFSAEVGSSLTPELIARLPQGNRNFLSFADLAPGVVSSPDADGNISFRGGGQRANATNVFIDGVSQKDYVLNGGITGQDSSRGNPFPQAAISEYNVISSNFKAEFDHIGSAAIVAVTKKGGNELHGGAFIDYTDSDLRARTINESRDGAVKAETSQKQYGLWLSGPIVEDKLHFFASYERKENDDLRELDPGGPDSLLDNLPQNIRDAVASNNGSFIAPFEQDLFFGKLDWNVNEQHQLGLSVKYRDETDVRDIGGTNSREAGVNGIVDDLRVNLTHEYRNDNILNKLTLTYEDASRNPTPVNNLPGASYSFARSANDAETIINLGGARDYQDKGQKGWGIQDDITWDRGEHTFKAGVKLKSLDLSGVEINPFNPQVFYSFDATGIDIDNDSTTILDAVPYRIEFTDPVDPTTPFVESTNTRFGIYLQDEWDVSDQLVVDLGLRWDIEKNSLYSDYKTPDAVVTALRANDNINHANSGYDIEDYISTGSNRNIDTGAWAPRFGFNYQVNDDHSVFGGFGRAYNRVQFDFLQLEATRERFSRYNVNFMGDHQFDCNDPCIAFDEAYLEPGGAGALPVQGSREVFAIDNDLETPYSDQLSLGLRSDWDTWNTEIGYNRIASRDEFVFLLGNRRAGGLFYPEGVTFSDAPWGESISSDYSVLLLGTNGGETTSDAFYAKIEKPQADSKWGGSLLYTYTDAEENVRFGGPFDALDPRPNDFGFFKAAGVSPHVVVATLVADLPLDIKFSGKMNLRSGEPFYGQQCYTWTPVTCAPIQGSPEKNDFLFLNDAFAFQQVDVSFSRNFNINDKFGGVYARVDVLNLLDFKNQSPGGNRFIDPSGVNPNFGAYEGNLVGPTRTVKFSLGYNF